MNERIAATRMSRRSFVASLSIGVVAVPDIARAAVRTARIGFAPPEQSTVGAGARAFAQAVSADPVLNGVLKVELYGGATAGDDMTMLKNTAKGTLDGVLSSSSIVASMVPELGVLGAPYLFASADQARAVMAGSLGTEFMALCAAKGVPVLAWGEQGMRHITANQPIRAVADLRGLKLRVPPSELVIGGFRALGANPAPLPLGLVREALRSGEFQAQENPISNIDALKLAEVQKYLCLTGHNYDVVGFVVSPDLLEDLTEPQRAALAACARKGAAATRDAADGSARDGIGRLEASGMTVVKDVDIAGLRAAARPYQEGLAGKFGAARVQALMSAANA